jgi:hypothetical protein
LTMGLGPVIIIEYEGHRVGVLLLLLPNNSLL